MSEQNTEKKRSLAWRWRVCLAVLFLLLVYTLSGFFLLPKLLKTQVEKRSPELLQRQVTIAKVQFNPFTLRLMVDGFVVHDSGDKDVLFKIDSLLLDVAGFLSLSNQALVLEQIEVQRPYLKVIRNRDLSYNFSDILNAATANSDKKEETDAESEFHFSLNNITMVDGLVEFDDNLKNTVHKIADIAIGLPSISNLPYLVETNVEPSLSATVNATPLLVKGTSQPFNQTLETHFKINLDQLDIPRYLSYLPGKRNFTIASGSLSTRLDLAYIQPEKGDPRLTLGGTMTLDDLLVSGQDDEKDYRFVSVPEILFTLGAGNILAGEIFLEEILCHKPEVNFLLKPDGVFYLPMLIMAATDNEQKSAAATRPGKSEKAAKTDDNFIFKLGKLHLDGGVVAVYDKRVSPAFATRFTPVDFTLENVTTVAGGRARYELNLQSDLGESFAASGDLSLDPFEVETHFDLQGLLLPNYAAYYRDYFTGQFSSGQVGVRGDVTVAKSPAGEITMLLQGFECKLDDCKLSTPDDKLVLDLPRFALAQTLIDFDKRECVIGSIEGERGSLNLIRQDDGTLNLVDLLPQAVQPQEVNPDNSKKIDSAVVSAPNQTTEKPWHLLLTKAHLQGFAVDFKDLVPRDDSVIKADKITLDIEQLGTGAGESGNLSLDMRLAGKGKLSVKGAVGVDPLKVELNINLQKMPLQVLQNYLNEHLELVLVSGRVATKCRLLLHEDGANENRINFSGELSLDNLKTVDNERAADIFSLRHLELNRLNYDSRSPALSLHRALFEGLQVNVVKGGDGLTNLEKIVIKDESAKTPPVDTNQPQVAEKPNELALDFKQLEFTDSSLSFLDRSLSPSVEMVLADLAGSITGLTSLDEKPAAVKLSGKLNDQAPVSISGSINPLGENVFVDLQVKGEGLGLTTVSPYSGKYVGHAISKGKVSFALDYKVEGHQLKAQNVIFLDQFDFGSTVESSDAMSLPVKLAVSLLRNRQGEIDLNLPIEGDLSDPEFSLGGIIIKVIVNLIVKAATSPFALIGSLAGGGGDLNLVTFVAGQAELDASAGEQLQKLAGVLYDRPGLKVELIGRADGTVDRDTLQEAHFMKLLKAQKFKDMATKNRPPVIADVVVEKDEFQGFLWQAYKAAPIKKEKILLLVKKIEPLEQERLLREFVKVGDDELLTLARKRARAVMSFLVAKGPLEAKRLFLVAPQLLSPDGAAATEKGRQVEIKIK